MGERQSDGVVRDPPRRYPIWVTVCVASGDGGCAIDDRGHAQVAFPASSPFVLGNGKNSEEVVWNDGAQDASGGGVSDLLKRPAWQPFKNMAILPSPPRLNKAFDGRRLPDVAGLAASLYCIYVEGGYLGGVGGTSAVPALWAALIARVNDGLTKQGLNRIGHFNPLLYKPRRFRIHSTTSHVEITVPAESVATKLELAGMLVRGGALRMEPDSSRNWQNSEWMGGTTCKLSQAGSDPEPELFQEGWHRPKTSPFQPGIFSLRMDKLINGIWKVRKRIKRLSILVRPVHHLLNIMLFLVG